MRIGPFSGFHINQLEVVLKQNNIEYSVFQDADAIEKNREIDVERTPHSYPVYQSNGDYLYLDLAESDVKTLRPMLENFGIVMLDKNEPAEDFISDEYYCVSCDFKSDVPGLCRQHNTSLVTFAEWVSATAQASSKKQTFVVAAILLVIVVLGLFLRK